MDEEEEIELGKRFDYEENKEQIGPDEETVRFTNKNRAKTLI